MGNSPKPVDQISLVSNQRAESNSAPANEITAVNRVKISAFPTPKKESARNLLEKVNPRELKKFGLYDLEKQQISKDDLEVRVWQITDLYMNMYKDLGVQESVFILKQTKGNWSAKVLRNVVNQNLKAKRKIITKLDAPKSDWENVWQNLINNELLTFPDSVNGKVEYANDAGICIIESKVGGIYKTYTYAGQHEVREIRHTAKILNIIADEFDLEDFQATKKYEE